MKLLVVRAVGLLLLHTGRSLKLNVSADATGCALFKCPDKYVPKNNANDIKTDNPSRDDCCAATCQVYVESAGCSAGFKSNPKYFLNVASTDQHCCDKECGNDFSCDTNYAKLAADTVGVSKEECCGATCALFNCSGHWNPVPSKRDVIGNTLEACCTKKCDLWTCPANAAWASDDSKANVSGSSAEACCMPTCKNDVIKCDSGYLKSSDKENESAVNGNASCCVPQCKLYQCSAGFDPDPNKSEVIGSNDSECCMQTCRHYDCPLQDGWANDSSKASVLLPSNSSLLMSTCCTPTCRQWTCNATEDWLTPAVNESKDDVKGETSETCCVRSCHYTTCPAGKVNIPAANSTPGGNDDRCCEPDRCPFFRSNKTELGAAEWCNGLSEDVCGTKYAKHKKDNGTVLPCTFDKTYNLCRFDTDHLLAGCRGI